MLHRNHLHRLAPIALALTACSGGSSVSNAAPRIQPIAAQAVAGGSTFTLDLGDYVTDREGAALTYDVVSGGGAFAGSVYSQLFPTMGNHTVVFAVSDGDKTATASFDVRVTSANFAVVREDDAGLLLLDTTTSAFVRVAGSAAAPSLATGLPDGRLVYQLGSGVQQLWIFDPMTRAAVQLAPQAAGSVQYRATTGDGRIVYSVATGGSFDLFVYNPRTGLVASLTQQALATLTVAVGGGLVYYEAAVNGQADVFGYDPLLDETFAIGTAATDEQIQGVLPNGAVVFSRVGAGGEADLFYYRVSTGLVEIGADMAALDTRNKTYAGAGSGSQVVFTALSGSDEELFAWNPANGQTTAIATGVDTVVDGIGAGNEVVYRTIVSPTEHDISLYDLDDGTSASVRNASDLGAVLAIVDGGSTRWAIVQGSSATSSISAVSLVASPSTVSWAAGGTVELGGVLANGDVVAQRADGTALRPFLAATGSWGTAIAGTGLAFGGDGLDQGDFVYRLTAAGQTDLSMWDASAVASVVVSDVAGDDAFAARTLDGTVLFTRIVAGNTNADLFVWDGVAATRLTDQDAAGLQHDHVVLGTYAGSR